MTSHIRRFFSTFMQNSKTVRVLFKRTPLNIFESSKLDFVKRYKANITPSTPIFNKPSMFSIETIAKNPDVVPIVVILLGGVLAESVVVARLAITRDDVRYRPATGKMNCEYVEMRKGRKPPIRKMIVFNQKYENPPGLIEAIRALEEPTEAELQQMEEARLRKEKEKGKKKKK